MKRILYITSATPSPTNLGRGQRSNLNLHALPESGEVDCILIGSPSFITDEHLEISRDDYGMIAPSYFVPSLAQRAHSFAGHSHYHSAQPSLRHRRSTPALQLRSAMKILLTGCAGFIGSHTLDRFVLL